MSTPLRNVAGSAVRTLAHPAAAFRGAEGLFAGMVDSLRGPVVAIVRSTLLRPLSLPPSVAAAWSVTRDIALGLVTVALLYGVLRAQVGAFSARDSGPWHLLPRLALAALGVLTSLPLARGLLEANNVLVAGLLAGMPSGGSGVLGPLSAGLALTAVPVVLGVGADVLAALLLVGLAALAVSYVVRSAEIVLWILVLPIAAATWVVPAGAGFWRFAFGQLVAAIFVQSAQVLVLLVFAAGLAPAPSGGTASSWLWGAGALFLLFRVRPLVSRAVGGVAAWAAEASVAGWLRSAAGGLSAGGALRRAAGV